MAVDRLMKSAPVRKGIALAQRLPRAVIRMSAQEADYLARPPIIVNSLPKSGTHLLMQIAERLPGARRFGTFIAQTPSLSLRMRSQAEINVRIAAIVPGEVVGAHLFYTPETSAALAKINALHLFIWRDPRDVILSEAHYLTHMARWHAMHRQFAALPDRDAQVRLAITGSGEPRYPGAEDRIGAYMGWTKDEASLAFRYEDLISPDRRAAECRRIVDSYAMRAKGDVDVPDIQTLLEAVDPERSHTFHKGGVARWRTEMSPEHQAMCETRLGKWLSR